MPFPTDLATGLYNSLYNRIQAVKYRTNVEQAIDISPVHDYLSVTHTHTHIHTLIHTDRHGHRHRSWTDGWTGRR